MAATHQLVHLRSQLSALVGSAQVVVYHDPAAIGKSVAKGVDIATHIGVGIKNEEPNLPCAGDLPHHCDRVRIERTAIYQSNLIEETEAFQILHQIFETIFRADPRVIDAAPRSMLMIFFSVAESRTPMAMAIVAPPMFANLENVAHADFGAVVKHDNRVDAEHGTIGRFHELMMQSFLLAILDQLSHQLETVTDIGVGVQSASLGC